MIPHSKPCFDESDHRAMAAVLDDGFVTHGRRARELGELAAGVLGRKWGVATQSGTDALATALLALRPLVGDVREVLVPAYICSAPLDAAAMAGMTPLPVDIDRRTLAISVEAANHQAEVAAVVGAHLFGVPAPLSGLNNRNLIEDCAQTLLAEIDGAPVGGTGILAVCSLYGTKLLAAGHGGILAGDDESLFESVMDLLVHDKRGHWRPRYHFLMSDLNAALGTSQIRRLPTFVEERRRIAVKFTMALAGEGDIGAGVFSRFLVEVVDGAIEDMLARFQAAGIEAKRPVYKPLYALMNRLDAEFPNAHWAQEHIISVPIYPGMAECDIECIAEFLEGNRDELCRRAPA